MKKWSEIKKETVIKNSKPDELEFKTDKPTALSNDIEQLQDQLQDYTEEVLTGEWEITSIIDVSIPDRVEEKTVIHADLSNTAIKKGGYLYITAMLNKPGTYYTQNKIGVIKVKIIEIFNNLQVLNYLK